jgi:hypothetical protein
MTLSNRTKIIIAVVSVVVVVAIIGGILYHKGKKADPVVPIGEENAEATKADAATPKTATSCVDCLVNEGGEPQHPIEPLKLDTTQEDSTFEQ